MKLFASIILILTMISLDSCVTCENVRRYEMPNRSALRIEQYLLPYDSVSYSSCSALYFIDDKLIFISDKQGYSIVPPSLFIYFSRFNTIK